MRRMTINVPSPKSDPHLTTPVHGSEGFEYSVATTPPNLWQRQLAFAVIVITLTAYAVLIPFAEMPLPRIDSFIPTMMAAIFVSDLVTALLLFGMFSASGSRPLLVLAAAYLFSSLIVIPYTLSFPNAFAPTGLLGGAPEHRLDKCCRAIRICLGPGYVRLPNGWKIHERRERSLSEKCDWLEHNDRHYCGLYADLGRYRRTKSSAGNSR